MDTAVAGQTSCTKVFASGGSFQDVCGELIGVVQGHSVQNTPFISNLLCKCLATLQALPFAELLPHTSLCGCCHGLIVGTEHIARLNATSYKRTLTLFLTTNFAFRILLCVWISMFTQEMKIAEKQKIKINKNVNAADDQRIVSDKPSSISIELSMSFAMHCG